MSKNMTIGAVATVCILLVLCFSYFTCNGSEGIQTGEYECLDCKYAYYDANYEPHVQATEADYVIIIDSAKGNFVKGSFNGISFIGVKDDDKSFTFRAVISGYDLNAYVTTEKNTLVLSFYGIKTTNYDVSYNVKLKVCIASFTVKGQSPAVDPASLIPDQSGIKAGTNWNSVQAFCDNNGETSDIEQRNYEILMVQDGFFFANSKISTQEFHFAGTFFGKNAYKATYADFSTKKVFTDDIVFTEKVIYTSSVVQNSDNSLSIYSVNYAKNVEDIPSFDIIGRSTFTGTIETMSADGTKHYQYPITVDLGNQYKNVCLTELNKSKVGLTLSKLSDGVYHVKYSEVTKEGLTLFGEGTYVESTNTVTLSGFAVKDGEVISTSKITAQKVDAEPDIIGTHTVSESKMAYIEDGKLYTTDINGTVEITVDSVENGIAKGTFAGIPFTGTYSSGKLSFAVTYLFDDGDRYYYVFEGTAMKDCIIAEIIAYNPATMENLVVSATYGESPEMDIDSYRQKTRTIQLGETWYSYDAYSNIAGKTEQITLPYSYTYLESADGFDHMRCVNSTTGEVFEFVGTHNGKLFLSTTEGKVIIDHIDVEDGILKTSSTSAYDNITAYVVSYSADSVPTDKYPELEGKTYVGTEFYDMNGEQKSVKVTLKFNGQYKNTVTIDRESNKYSQEWISVSKFSGNVASFYSAAYFDIDGDIYSGMYKGYFSEDYSTLTVYGIALDESGKQIAIIMDLNLEA